ncbi:prolipoprotein diacylglyceryl transferase [Mycobacterium persicum]|uniref:Phosphatidylglycerol--prolipoprotein diacylglyceryl transferase n=2 Tax=Mycobacterium persicum TaxID=1487726 RepID=A0A1X0LG18_9MYCO|nr:prolipoprotein diacylglyceryl transferase [Mycobacterium persicum]ORB58541.1 prolipoprotein diacylglyceryl transferase [Mycobacterium persicum]ORB92292.1 prolipoprotein diacylglyceryl transferase [Mycobacterium persicum]ORB97679.1 prolipoprotein diacylglyceryl transferase [Mycobacterium persicum]ORC09746.1 prolipoprotein diacylglyceryl transferase [Mycobacterium persicum]VAZ75222.1 Prolipoprotein diacylglyceryl transferase [Mycobacterium persicum]
MTTMWLAYIPSPPRGVWHLGPLPIRAYALFIITGIIVALLIGDRRFAARGGERGVIYDIALWMVPFGLIGGRLYHLATDWRTYFGHGGAGFAAALRIWDGGLGIWGAIALGAVGAWIACRRRGIPLPAFLDAAAPAVVLAQAIGRLGNYFNQELYGRETTVPWGLEIFYRRDPAGFVDVHSLDGVSTGQLAVVVHPTFLYELLWNVLVFGVLIYLDRRFTIGHGRLFGLYVALYCVGRFGVELMRDDTATHIAGIRINLFTSTFVFIGAVVYVILAPKGREDPATVRGTAVVGEEAAEPAEVAAPEAEPAAVSSGSAAVTAVAGAADAEDDQPTASAETQRAGEPAEPQTLKTSASEDGTTDAQEAQTEEPETGEEAAEVVPQAEAEPAEAEEAEQAEAEPAEAEEAEQAEAEPAGAEEAEQAEVEPVPVPEEPEVDEARAEESELVVDEAEAESVTDEAEAAEAEAESAAGEPELAAPAAETEAEEAEASEPDAEDTTAPKAAAENASGGADDQDDHLDGDQAPSVPNSPTPDNTGSTRQGWRARLRNRRQRPGR